MIKHKCNILKSGHMWIVYCPVCKGRYFGENWKAALNIALRHWSIR